ncbi:MAG: HD domain-containing protein [Bdellovibrionales bacterium]|nr:HD domain-containing protein [Bdellovibrionales bacterium]
MDSRYFNIRVGSLLPDRPLPFDLFVVIQNRYVHYLRAGNTLSPEKIAKLNQSDRFFIPQSQRQNFKDFIYGQLALEEVPAEIKAQILRESSLALVEEIYENPDVGKALADSKELIHGFVKFMEQEPEGMGHLISLSSHDFYTYNHSLDVGVYALGLGRLAGYSEVELEELGRGALFHDVGKKWVDVDIICKKGALDDVEWAQMKNHPEYGLQILNEYEDVSEAIKACCYEHHESFLGNGYPQELPGEEIHPMARIIAITDTYDALTTQRSYNKPMTPKDAIDFMTTKLKDRYDPDLLKILREVMFAL